MHSPQYYKIPVAYRLSNRRFRTKRKYGLKDGSVEFLAQWPFPDTIVILRQSKWETSLIKYQKSHILESLWAHIATKDCLQKRFAKFVRRSMYPLYHDQRMFHVIRKYVLSLSWMTAAAYFAKLFSRSLWVEVHIIKERIFVRPSGEIKLRIVEFGP